VRRAIVLGLALVVVLVTAFAWLQRPDHITATEAVRAARDAFEAAGLDVVVADQPEAGSYDPGGSEDRIAVWRTSARIDGATIGLWLSRDDGEAVFLDDLTPDGTSRLLSDAQFQAVGDHYENPALGRQVRRNLVVTAAAVLILAVLAVMAAPGRRPTTPDLLEHP
jgi:hypothetical protein